MVTGEGFSEKSAVELPIVNKLTNKVCLVQLQLKPYTARDVLARLDLDLDVRFWQLVELAARRAFHR